MEQIHLKSAQDNQDLQMLNQESALDEMKIDRGKQDMQQKEEPVPDITIKRKIVRKAQEDGFFKTGVEVVEHEEIDFEKTAHQAAELLKRGDINAKQIRQMLEKKLKDDRIFGFKNYEEFN